MALPPAPPPLVNKRPPRIRSLDPVRLRRADLERPHHVAIVPSDTTFDEVMTPAYWQHHVATLSSRPFGRIEVVREDGTMDLDLRVVKASAGMVLMRCLRKFVDDSNLSKAAAPEAENAEPMPDLPDGYKWAHVPNGANRGHMVRLPNGEVLVQGKATKREAVLAAIAHNAVASTPATETTPAPSP